MYDKVHMCVYIMERIPPNAFRHSAHPNYLRYVARADFFFRGWIHKRCGCDDSDCLAFAQTLKVVHTYVFSSQCALARYARRFLVRQNWRAVISVGALMLDCIIMFYGKCLKPWLERTSGNMVERMRTGTYSERPYIHTLDDSMELVDTFWERRKKVHQV